MRFSTELLVLAHAVTALALPQGAPAPGPKKPTEKSIEQIAPPLKAMRSIDAKAVLRPGAQRKLVQFGPFTIPASDPNTEGGHEHGGGSDAKGVASGKIPGAEELFTKPLGITIAEYLGNNMDPAGFGVLRTISGQICSNCTVLASQVDIVTEDGKRASIDSGIYLHHAIALDIATNRKMKSNTVGDWVPFCNGFDKLGSALASQVSKPQDKEVSVFSFGAVDEFKQMWTSPDGQFGSGYYLGADDKMLMQAELINYNKQARSVYLQFDVEYVPGEVGKQATTTFITTTDCDKPMVFMGVNGKGTHKGNDLIVQDSATVLSARGHMHDGGSSMQLFLNDKLMCESKAIYGTKAGEGNWTTISEMQDCQKPFHVVKGDRIRADALYDTIAHPLRSSGGKDQAQMGLFAMSAVID